MTTKIDKFGRILIPKPIRQRLGLLPGSPVSLVEGDGGKVEITAERSEPMVARRGRLLVYTGPLGDVDPVTAVREIQEERADRHAGLS
tara:strand:+ start:305 stop:568 length:264 start_codon:yes stop_codon:yes gene_type:complete